MGLTRRKAGWVAITLVLAACSSFPLGLVPTTTTDPTTTTTTTSTTTTIPTTTTTTLPPVEATGRVVDPDGRPIAGVTVRLGESLATTLADGSFLVSASTPSDLIFSGPGRVQTEVGWHDGEHTVTLEPMVVRGLRVGAGAAGNEDLFNEILDLAERTVVNALVFDTKQEGGQVLYDTTVQEAHQIGAVAVHYDPHTVLARAKGAGLYTITRIVAFEDRFRANAYREEKLAGPWVDPAAPGVRRYNLDLAIEACSLGFDEIQFDYVRYPTGVAGQQGSHRNLTEEQRVANIASFLELARAELAPLGCAVSADIFGIVVSTANDQGIGQIPEDLSRHLDAISPMVYPSHYDNGWIGLANPNDHPYRVVANALDSAGPRVEAGVLRPWLQAFWWTNQQIRESIRAAEERGVGWLLWNSGSRFDLAAIPVEGDG